MRTPLLQRATAAIALACALLPSTALAQPAAAGAATDPAAGTASWSAAAGADLAQVDGLLVGVADHRASSAVAAVADGGVDAVAPGVVTVAVDDPAAALAELADAPGVAYAEPDWPLAATAVTTDPYLLHQWGLRNTGQQGGTPGADIDALTAWDHAGDAGQVVVGIVDSGIAADHPDLSARMWRNAGELASCPVGATGLDLHAGTCSTGTDPSGHGTHVAGTVGAAVDNGVGVAGVAPNAQLLDLRFLGADGTGTTSKAVAAIRAATDLALAGVPVRVLNASFGGGGASTSMRDAIRAAGDAGILVVAAAGNSGIDVDTSPQYPCAYDLPNLLCVAATTRTDGLASFSNRGDQTVHLGAPGVGILSTVPDGYAGYDGTSMAAPHVAGAAALVSGACRTGVTGLAAALLDGVDPVPALASTTVTGGRLDAARSLQAAGCGTVAPPGTPGPALLGPDGELSWSPGGATSFTVQRASSGSSSWTDVASGLTAPRLPASALPEGTADVRVLGTADGQTAVSPRRTDLVVDRTAPALDVRGCPGAPVAVGSDAALQVTATDAGSGLSQDPSGTVQLDTRTEGTRTAEVVATDNVGLRTARTCSYEVAADGAGSQPAPPPEGADPLDAPAPEGTAPAPGPATPPSRIDEPTPAAAALTVSSLRFTDVRGADATSTAADRTAAHAVLARDDAFADALAGASLTGDGPLLLTGGAALDGAVAAELQRVLPAGGTVYLLGGAQALAPAVEAAVADLGLEPVRLAGLTRVETALAVAGAVAAAHPDGDRVLLARADGPADNPTAAWADAISAGPYGAATGTPVLLTASSNLHPAVAAWVAASGRQPVLVGGASALSDAVAVVLGGAARIEGSNRAATAVAVATELWGAPQPLTAATVIDGWAVDGWAYGLAGAGLAADLGAPLLLVGDQVPPATADALACTDVVVLGGEAAVPASVAAELESGCPSS